MDLNLGEVELGLTAEGRLTKESTDRIRAAFEGARDDIISGLLSQAQSRVWKVGEKLSLTVHSTLACRITGQRRAIKR